jgi:polyisoprenoid-binding protein YceI
MTIKGIAKSISFPAEVHADSSTVAFKAAFAIDRTAWGVNYGSENSIKDKIISKNIDFQINIKAGH